MLDRFATLRRPARVSVQALAAAVIMSGAALFTAGNAAAAPNAAIVVDAKSGKVLYSSNPDAKRHPASLTKMMTLYMLFESIDSGKSSLKTKIKMSSRCAGQAPSKLGLKPGQTISARDAILALVTKSANDVACAIGEHLGGSESAFAKKMTSRAHALGMSKTTFRNASGLPDAAQVTSARDMALLGRALQQHFPEHYKYFSTRSFKWKGNTIGNHNRLLGRVEGVDGIKTGYTRASGFNLVTSVKRGDRQIVAVVLGGDTGKARDQRMAALIKDYIPRASKGPRTASIAEGAPNPDDVEATAVVDATALAAVANVEGAPVPPKRPLASDPIVTASVVGANSIFALAAVEQGDASAAVEEMAATATAPEAPPPVIASGWKIQLAATPNQSSALEILDRAQAKAPKVLADASPYTESVVKEDVTLYRARFTGFADKDAARAACAQLVKQKLSCLALSD
jgi:D-alanyl-D-alanine carboxypeptidase